MLKSDHDKRQFKYLTLDNNLRVFLIQDSLCEKSAVALTVNSGHFNDSNDCQGLSHLLEHMLFLGNETFPEPNQLSNILDSVGGSINAQTGTEYTSYFLESPEKNLMQAIHSFSAMITQPLLKESSISKEILAIDAEFHLKKKDELRRLYQVHKETCNPAHPFSQFSVGNKDIFDTFTVSELKSRLQQLHSAYYQPQNTCICIISSSRLSELENMVIQHMAHWKKSSSTLPEALPNLYLPQNLGLKIHIKPLQNTQRLIITFALPNTQADFRSKPLTIISHLLGDEGEGSLLNFYKQKKWALNLSAGGGIEGKNFKDFNINIQLTSLGLENIDHMIQALFSLIQLIKSNGIEYWRIEEVARMNQLTWDFSDKTKNIDEALHYSQSMFEYSPKYLLVGDHILDKIKPELVINLLKYFHPQNMRVKTVSPCVTTTQVAKWYNTPYKVDPLNAEQSQTYLKGYSHANLSLPQPNQFLSNVQSSKAINTKYNVPKQIVALPSLNIWYGQDSQFSQPKGDCFLTFDCQAVNQGIKIIAAKRLWIALLNEELNQKYYQADLAGMHFHFYPHQGGFSLQTNGLSHNQLTFCAKLLTQIMDNEDFEQRFEQVKERQVLSLSNKLLNKPINRLFSRLAVLMQQQNYLPSDMASSMEDLTLEDITSIKNKLLSEFHLEGLIYGDWSIDEASSLAKTMKTFKKSNRKGKKVKRGVSDIREEMTLSHKVECQHPDSGVVVYFQSPDASFQTTALTIILEQLIAGPFFHQLRTEQQLGYLVGSGYVPYNQHPGLAFYIQSPHTLTEQLIPAIHQFIERFVGRISEYTDVWPKIKKGVIKQLSEKDSNLSMKSQRLWMAISNQDYGFSNTDKMVQEISNMPFLSLKKFSDKLLSRDGFGEIILYCEDSKHQITLPNSRSINNPRAFKKTTPYL